MGILDGFVNKNNFAFPEGRIPSKSNILSLFERLLSTYGRRLWWPSDNGGTFEIVCGAILTQNTSWKNVEKALKNMQGGDVWNWKDLHLAETEYLEGLVRPSGYFRVKARKLKEFASVVEENGGTLETFLPSGTDKNELRRRLLSIWGIGEETADAILLYAAGKASFVIDKYTIRIARRLGWRSGGDRYSDWQRLFEENLDSNPDLFNEYHALLDWHGSRVCTVNPKCSECCLTEICDFGKVQIGCRG